MRNNWIRFVAGALVSVVLVGVFALTGGMKSGKSTEGLLYQASGLHPDGEMLVVDGQIVTCEEYLYWVDYACQYISSRIPDVDWNEQVSEDGMTYGEYVKVEAVETVKQYAVIRAWAQQEGVRRRTCSSWHWWASAMRGTTPLWRCSTSTATCTSPSAPPAAASTPMTRPSAITPTSRAT